MDENRLKKICELALESRNVIVSEFNVLHTNQYDSETGKWVPHSYTLFIGVKRVGEVVEPHYDKLDYFLESLLGFECVVDFT